MAIKKSDLYSSLWASCDELRGGMDASQYKDYVLFMLFIKYITDKYGDSDDFAPPVNIPKGASFKDMIALKGKSDIGDKINTQIIQPLIDANSRLARSDFPDFNDPNKLGEGRRWSIADQPDRHLPEARTRLLAEPRRARRHPRRRLRVPDAPLRHRERQEQGAVLHAVRSQPRHRQGDRHLAANTQAPPPPPTTPPAARVRCCSRWRPQAGKHITLEGQEKDVTTAGLARMNMILHDFPTANILSGNTLAAPKFKDGEQLRTYDYVVANPPFSDKTWSTGLTPSNDPWQRFAWGEPPAKQGDYAYLLHIIRSLKGAGKGACILPHGVLFRGNAEAVIRRQLVRSGILKGIIGLPANLFYGTGIPACILVLDKENATARKGVFMIDASKGFIKDGNKNRLREQDIHRIVDTFTRQADTPRYARMVPFDEIADAKNDFNLNLPRYIDSSEPEDLQDIDGHLRGGIPERDLDALGDYWQVLPGVRAALFESLRAPLRPPQAAAARGQAGHLRPRRIHRLQPGGDPALRRLARRRHAAAHRLRQGRPPQGADRDHRRGAARHLQGGAAARRLRHLPAPDGLLGRDDAGRRLPDRRRRLGGQTGRIVGDDKKGKARDKGWTCDLIPKPYLVARYFASEQAAIEAKQAELEAAIASLAELEEEHGGEDAAFSGFDSISAAAVKERIREVARDPDAADELRRAQKLAGLNESIAALKKKVRESEAALDRLAYEKYPTLSEAEIKTLVVDDKWMARLSAACRASWIASRRRSPAASASWPNATPRRCRSSPTRWRCWPAARGGTPQADGGGHGSEAGIQADGGGLVRCSRSRDFRTTHGTTRHRGGVERCGCAAGRAGAAHRQEARPQTGRHAATPHRPNPPAGVSAGSGR
jgi:type I restriction enzyme M protein